MNLDVKLGGLGPDYEAIKEKVSGAHIIQSAFQLCNVSLGRGEWQRNHL